MDGVRRSDTLCREVRIAATPDTVFAYLTESAKISRWAGVEASSDPRLGGVYRTVINAGHIIGGEYVEVVPARKIVCTWGWIGSAAIPQGSTIVEIVLTPDGPGTVVTVSHAALPDRARDGHAEVWDHYLPRLATASSGGDPGPDPWAGDAPHFATQS